MGTNVDVWKGEGALPTLYSKTATGAVNYWQCWVEEADVCVRWGQVNGAAQEARFECKPKNEGKTNETSAAKQAIKEAIAKWKKQIKKKYSETRETAGETLRFKPMLALDFQEHKHKLVYPVTVQPKFDGLRCLVYKKHGEVYLQSRGGDPYLLPLIQQQMSIGMRDNYSDFIFDGELYLHGVSLQTISSLVRKPKEESKELKYNIYDCFCSRLSEAPWRERMNWVSAFFVSYARYFRDIQEVTCRVASDENQVRFYQQYFVAEGYEGGIVRGSDGTYREGYRSPDLLKVKDWKDEEFPIIGWTVGKGKFSNVPIFKCVTKEGRDFDVAPKGTSSERQALLNKAPELIGKLMKVKFFQWTDDMKPQFPVGLGIRDKSDL